MAEHYTTCAFNLIVEKLAKILHVHLALISINDRCKSAKHRALGIRALNRLYNVGKLANARRLNKDSVRSVFRYDLLKCRRKISYERATDTARIHFVYLNSRLCKKSAVNTYLTEFIFNKNYLLALVRFLNKLLYKRGFSCAEKSRKNINSCHFIAFRVNIFHFVFCAFILFR